MLLLEKNKNKQNKEDFVLDFSAKKDETAICVRFSVSFIRQKSLENLYILHTFLLEYMVNPSSGLSKIWPERPVQRIKECDCLNARHLCRAFYMNVS